MRRSVGWSLFVVLSLVTVGILAYIMRAMTMPANASPVNAQWLDLYNITLYIAIAVGVVVFALILFILIRFAGKPGEHREGPHIHGNTRMEIAWTIAPTLIMAYLLVLSFNGLSIVDQPRDEEIQDWIKVEASQFIFTFTYPDGSKSSNGSLRLEQNRVYGFEITSVDVIHAFSVPDLGVMKDAVPGKTTYSWVKATQPGVYAIKCRELCGAGHSAMAGRIDEAGNRTGYWVYVFPEGSEAPHHWGFAEDRAAPSPQPTGGTTSTPPSTTSVTVPKGALEVNLTNFAIAPKLIKVEKGQNLTFAVHNQAGIHNFYIGNFTKGVPDEGKIWGTPETLAEGATSVFSVTFPDMDQTYQIWCQKPGHKDLGMSGTIIVGEGSLVEEDVPYLPGPELGPTLLVLFLAAALILLRRRG